MIIIFHKIVRYYNNKNKYLLSRSSAPGLRYVAAWRYYGVTTIVEQFGYVGPEIGLGVPTSFAGRRFDARVDGRLAPLPGRRHRVGPTEWQCLCDVGQRLTPGDTLGPAATSLAATAAATAAHSGAAPLAQYVSELS